MKILGTKMMPEIPFKNQLKAENKLRLNQFQSARDESGRVQGFTIEMRENS